MLQLAHSANTAPQRDRLLRRAGVESLTGLKTSTLYGLIRKGLFPAPIQITPRCVAWSEAKVLAWVQAQVEGQK